MFVAEPEVRMKYNRVRSICVSDRQKFMYIIGGSQNKVAGRAIERYNPRTREVTEMPNLPEQVYNVDTACLFEQGRNTQVLYIISGLKMWSMNVASENPFVSQCNIDLSEIQHFKKMGMIQNNNEIILFGGENQFCNEIGSTFVLR